MNAKENINKKSMTKEQRKLLIQFMEDNPELQSGKFSQSFTAVKARGLWQELSQTLNSMPGCTKPWEKWRKAWQDLKSATKSKAATLKRSQQKTGGGVSPLHDLTNEEEKIVEILTPALVEGLPVEESSAVFSFDNEKDIMFFELQREAHTVVEPKTIRVVKEKNTKEEVQHSSIIESTPKQRKGTPKNRKEERLKHTVDATERMNELMAEKLKWKKYYNRRKLYYLKKDVEAKNRIAANLELLNETLREFTVEFIA